MIGSSGDLDLDRVPQDVVFNLMAELGVSVPRNGGNSVVLVLYGNYDGPGARSGAWHESTETFEE